MSAIQLRSFTFLDSLQPQLAAQMCTTSKGYFPTPDVASIFLEIAPGMAIHRLLDQALKGTRVQPGTIVVERRYGMMEIHHEDQGEVVEAGNIILKALEHKVEDRLKPRIVSNTVIRSVEPMHAMILGFSLALTNRLVYKPSHCWPYRCGGAARSSVPWRR